VCCPAATGDSACSASSLACAGVQCTCESGCSGSMVMRSDGTLWAYNNVEVTYQDAQPFIATNFASTQGAEFTTGTSSSTSSGLSCAVDNSGSGYVWCWGNEGYYGSLGNGDSESTNSTTSSNYPVQVVTNTVGPVYLSNIKSVFVDNTEGYSACAIDTSGNVWCWGYGYYGVLGQGPGGSGGAANSAVAVEITQNNAGGAFTNITTLSMTDQDVCALMLPSAGASPASGEEVWCWGYNYYGQVGVGSTATQTYYYPVQVTGLLSTATSIAVGYDDFACASTTGGNVYCWGSNTYGQLGLGSSSTPTTLTAPSGSTPVVTAAGGTTAFANATEVVATEYGACALKSTNDSLWCWGNPNEPYATSYVEDSFTVTNVYDLCTNGTSYPSYIDSSGYFHYGSSKANPQITCQ
jgi:alpha-tubulin suppressor-like RCC1 family protein